MAKSKIKVGVDAQPYTNIPKAQALGATFMHRFDSGPQKTVTLGQWVAACRAAKISYAIQGDVIEAKGSGVSWADLNADPLFIAVLHNDEPNLNRWPYAGTPAEQAEAAKLYYTPADAPHPSRQGWTRPSLLLERYKRWKAATDRPVHVNLAGLNITSTWYWDGAGDLPWIAATDTIGFDIYPTNSGPYPLYIHALCIDKLRLFAQMGGKDPDMVCEAYVDIVDIVLDGDENGGKQRGPTPNEHSTMFFCCVSRGMKRITLWTQQIGRDRTTGQSFDYWNVQPVNGERAARDIALLDRYAEYFENDPTSIVQTPLAQLNAYKGAIVWTNYERVTWELPGGRKLVADLDYTGIEDVKFTEVGAQAPDPIPPTQVVDLKPVYAEIEKAKAAAAEALAVANTPWKLVR